ncbi:hypothetical protein JW707_01820 [Candidatus Woesearchaeota archaeon]|nr:hypothetical protein [Candidatus Woesearchaeota archaeon]
MKKNKLQKMNVLLLISLVLALAVYAQESVQVGEINLTVWDTSDSQPTYDLSITTFYANYSNITSHMPVENASCKINLSYAVGQNNLTYDSNSKLYRVSFQNMSVGTHNFTVSCNKTGYPWLNATDNFTITNSAPVQNATIPNITIEEDTFYSVNLNNYFYEPDMHSSQSLGWNATSANNLTITIDNSTGIMNITPDANFYGLRSFKVTAVDNLNATNESDLIYVNVTNTPEVTLSSPINGSSGFYADTNIDFYLQVEDDYLIDNCSLYLNEALNQTEINLNWNTSLEAYNDSGVQGGVDPNYNIINYSSILTKKIDLLNTNFKVFRAYLNKTGSPSGPIIVKINGNNLFNISPSEISSGGSWVSKIITDDSVLITGVNNITFDAFYIPGKYYVLYDDPNSEYIVRLANNIFKFGTLNLNKGDYFWNAECYNNQSQGKQTEEWVLTVNNSAPTKPTTLTPPSGVYNDTNSIINISCGGSYDLDGDDISYIIQYIGNSEGKLITIADNLPDGNYIWNVSKVPADNIKLICYSSDTFSNSPNLEQISFPISIEHPGAPTTPTLLKCNGGSCASQTFGDEINISCYGSTDADSNFNYTIQAYYEDYDGIKWRNLSVVPASEGDEGYGNYTWDTSLGVNQTGVKIGCYAYDGIIQSSSKTEQNITISHPSAPTTPNLQPQSGIFEDEINITCNGSGNLIYEVYAYYNSNWNLLNNSLDENSIHVWDISSISEQDIDLKCRAYNGNYYSQFTTETVTIDRPPTSPNTLEPETGVYEYEINYSCSGSENLQGFNYYIDSYYNSGWEQRTDSFPGIPPVNDAELAYDDGVYTGFINQKANSFNLFDNFYIIVPNGNYLFCVKGYGTGAGPRFKLYWNCDSDFNNCNSDAQFTQLTGTEETYCSDVDLTGTSVKYLKIETRGDQSSNIISTYFDHAYLVAKPFTWDVSGIAPQANVDLRCTAYDSRGNSGEFNPSGKLIIDRIPKFNGSSSFSYSYNTVSYHNLSEMFYDEDNDALIFSSTNSSHISTKITGNNLTITPSAKWCGTETIQVKANDSLVETAQNISLSFTGCSGGGGTGTTEEEIPPPPPPVVVPTPEKPKEPEIEKPVEIPSGRKEKPIITDPIIQKIFDTKVKHTREYVISRSKTKIIERVKNIGFYDLEDIRARLTIPKTVAEKATDIEAVDSFAIIKQDPEIEFDIPLLKTNEEIELQYIINKRLSEDAVNNIIIEILPRELTEEERAEKEREIQEKIENTSKYITITKEVTTTEDTTEFKINLDIQENTILYDVSIFAEIPKCLVEIIKRDMIVSDVDFEIISEDPLIRWHFETLTSKEEINYLIKKAAEEGCADKTMVIPLAQKILIVSKKINYARALIPLLIVPLIIAIITFFSAYGYAEKEKLIEIGHLIKWAKRTRKKGYSWQGIAESLKRTRRYTEQQINTILDLASRPIKLLVTKLDIDIEEGILILIIILNILDFARFLPGEVDFAKKVISWTILGYLLFRVSITRVLFGCRCRNLDIMLLTGHFMLIIKNVIEVAQTEFIDAGYLKDLYALIANNAQLLETTFFTAGAVIIIAVSVYIAKRRTISEKSFMGVIKEYGEPPKSFFKLISRAFFVTITHLFFFLVVFNLMMEWLAIAVDAALVTAAIVFYLFVLIKHREKHWMLGLIYKIGNAGEKFYESFIDLFQNRKTILIGISGMLILHTLTEIGIFIIPYALGLYNPIYLASWQQGHAPIFNIYGWLRGVFGIQTMQIQSLFSQGTIGMGAGQIAVLLGMYLLNIIAIVSLLALPAFVWYHLYKNRKLPFSEVPRFILSRWKIALLASSYLAFILAPAFRLKGLFLRGLLGVDIMTSNIAVNPNLDLIFAIIAVSGLLIYLLTHISRKTRNIFNWIVLASAFVLFFHYIIFFFESIVVFYTYTIKMTVLSYNYFISFILLTFMALTILFYGFGTLSLLFELWLRNELQLRRILMIKKTPEWAKHFDMELLHHESAHEEDKHGKKYEMLKVYITREMERGHNFSTILMHIKKVGWSYKVIEKALAELSTSREFNQLTKGRKHKNSKSIAMLANYIQAELEKGVRLEKILKAIPGRGWNDTDLIDALISLKER